MGWIGGQKNPAGRLDLRLNQRLAIFAALPIGSLGQFRLQRKFDEIGLRENAGSDKTPANRAGRPHVQPPSSRPVRSVL